MGAEFVVAGSVGRAGADSVSCDHAGAKEEFMLLFMIVIPVAGGFQRVGVGGVLDGAVEGGDGVAEFCGGFGGDYCAADFEGEADGGGEEEEAGVSEDFCYG